MLVRNSWNISLVAGISTLLVLVLLPDVRQHWTTLSFYRFLKHPAPFLKQFFFVSIVQVGFYCLSDTIAISVVWVRSGTDLLNFFSNRFIFLFDTFLVFFTFELGGFDLIVAMEFCDAVVFFEFFFEVVGFPVVDFFHLSEMLQIHFFSDLARNYAIPQTKCHLIFLLSYIIPIILIPNTI